MSHRDLRAGERTITTLCRMCEQGCGLEVSLGPDGRPVRVQGDKNLPLMNHTFYPQKEAYQRRNTIWQQR